MVASSNLAGGAFSDLLRRGPLASRQAAESTVCARIAQRGSSSRVNPLLIPSVIVSRKAIAYIDGFNFYHGVVKQKPSLKWLDYVALCDQLLRGVEVTRVNYFTAIVKNRPQDLGQSQRQNDYLRALGANRRMTVVLGKFQPKLASVEVVNTQQVNLEVGGLGTLKRGEWVRGRVWEEKGSDVNLGTDLSWDACSGSMQVALVLSNDLDLQRSIDRAKDAGIEVVVVNPHHRTHAPSPIGTDTRKLHIGDLRKCQLPDIVTLTDGRTKVHRPATW